jgi:hydroxymethylpyrimidine/phosphomethylpyrimidine kinase
VPTPPVTLTIAGSDSGGGAGIAADLRTFAAHGVFGTLALTAVTAQNTEKVDLIYPLPTEVVDAQIDTVLADFSVGFAKTGMLANSDIVTLLIERADAGRLPRLVVDPVMVTTSGASLADPEARAIYRKLIGRSLIVTPNLNECEILLDRPVQDLEAMRDAARALVDLGAEIALVKGGHLDGGEAVDVVFDGVEIHELHAARLAATNLHGTGCTLSAAICANLARGLSVLESITSAKRYVRDAITAGAAWDLGTGPGPLNHFPLVES